MSLEPTPQEDRPHTPMCQLTPSQLHQHSFPALYSHTPQAQFLLFQTPGSHTLHQSHLLQVPLHTELQMVALLPTNMSQPQLVTRLLFIPLNPPPTVVQSPMLTPSTAPVYLLLIPHLLLPQPPHQVVTFHMSPQLLHQVEPRLLLTQPTELQVETLLIPSL
jgi:hypothetical protein